MFGRRKKDLGTRMCGNCQAPEHLEGYVKNKTFQVKISDSTQSSRDSRKVKVALKIGRVSQKAMLFNRLFTELLYFIEPFHCYSTR